MVQAEMVAKKTVTCMFLDRKSRETLALRNNGPSSWEVLADACGMLLEKIVVGDG